MLQVGRTLARRRCSLSAITSVVVARRMSYQGRCVSIRTQHTTSPGLYRIPYRPCISDTNHGNTNIYAKTTWRHNNHLYRHQSTVTEDATGVFDKSQFSSPDGFQQATEDALSRARALVADISSMADIPSVDIVVKMDELSDVLCQVADLSECVRLVHPDPSICDAAQNASLAINNYVEELNTDVALHRSLSNFMKSSEFAKADEVTKRTTELLMHDFEASGIHLDAEKREKVVEMNRKTLELSHQFMYNTSLPTVAPRKSCPPVIQSYFGSQDGAHVAIDHVPYLSEDRELRSWSYRLFFARQPTQEEILDGILDLRHRISILAGYPSFAHRMLKTCMVKNPEKAQAFLEVLSDKILPLATQDAKEMQKFMSNSHNSQILEPWDVSYCTYRAQKMYFPATASDLREYFSLENVLLGVGNLFQSLFSVSVSVVPVKNGEVWDESVIKLAFFHDTEGLLLGYTYCDLFARSGKLISDCHFTIQGGRELPDGSYQTPIIAICCNFKRRRNDTIDTSLLSQNSVEVLCHELGHALHSMLGRSRYQNVTGTRCSTDFAEVPSTLMEYFLNDSRVLESFARHYKTGQPIPESYLSTFQLSGRLFPAFDMQIQTASALTDLLLHTKQPLKSSSTDFATKLHRQYTPIQLPPGVTWLHRFNHFYGYGARYYSYLWSRAVSCLIWRRCFERDPFSRDSGTRLREMLQYGGGRSPWRLVRDMLDFEPTVEDLVDALHTDIIEHRQKLKNFTGNHMADK